MGAIPGDQTQTGNFEALIHKTPEPQDLRIRIYVGHRMGTPTPPSFCSKHPSLIH